MSIYSLDIDELAAITIPEPLRNDAVLAFVKSLSAHNKMLLAEALFYRDKAVYEMSHTGQVCRLEAVLNDTFDNSLRRIYITDAPIVSARALYLRVEDKPLYVKKRIEAAPVYMRKRAELTEGGAFIVNVPAAVVYDEYQMKALVNKYKLAGKDYSIKIV